MIEKTGGVTYVFNMVDQACADLAKLMNKPSIENELAKIELVAISGQEAKWIYKKQIKGPARGLWQFELGSLECGGGICGVFRHPATKHFVQELCTECLVDHNPSAIYRALEYNDLLAAYIARLLLWTDIHPLPRNEAEGWTTYIANWRPGKPHKRTWSYNYKTAVDYSLKRSLMKSVQLEKAKEELTNA